MNKDTLGLIDSWRSQQDAQWGGPKHDDAHTVNEWADYIAKQTRKLRVAVGGEEEISRLAKIAALAVAAIESLERKSHG